MSVPLLDPSRTVPGDLPGPVLRSPLLEWETATARRRRGELQAERRVAVVDASGVLDGVVAALASRCAVERADLAALAVPGVAAGYDAVLCAFGGTAADATALRVARRVASVVWLRSLSLAAAYRSHAAETHAPAAMLAATLRRCYADRVPQPVLERLDAGDASGLDAAAERRFGLLMAAELVGEARAVVVESEAQARRLRFDLGPRARLPRIAVVPAEDGDAAADGLLGLLSELAAT